MTNWFETMRVDGYQGPTSDHFDGERFVNLDPVKLKGLPDVLRWRFRSSTRQQWPSWVVSVPGEAPPRLVGSGQLRYTVINHASVLIQSDELNILADPIWSERCSPLSWLGPKRVRAPGLHFDDLPKIDAVLLSHNHYDHMDLPTLKKLEARDQPIFFAGLGNAEFLRGVGLRRVRDMDWWDSGTLGTQTIHFVPGRHFSRRGFSDAMKTLWGGFVLQTSVGSIYFAGDTGYGQHFTAIRERLGAPALSFLPIGAYDPRWFMGEIHLDPQQAVQAHQDLQSRQSVGIHFGTFQLTDEGIDDPAKELIAARQNGGLDVEGFLVPIFGQGYWTKEN